MDVDNGDVEDSVVVSESVIDDADDVSQSNEERESAEIETESIEPEKRRRTEEQEGDEEEDKGHRKSKRSKKVCKLHLIKAIEFNFISRNLHC
jgi:hypothetical protein